MSVPEAKGLYRGRVAPDVPLYSVPDVVRYLRLPAWRVSHHDSEWPWHFSRPVGDSGYEWAGRLSFRDLVDVFLRSAEPTLWALGESWPRPWSGPDSPEVTVLWGVRKRLPGENEAAIDEWAAERMQLYRGRIEYDGDAPVRLYPFTRGRADEQSPRVIAIDPRVGFGNPVVARRNFRVDALTSRFRAGEPVTALAKDCKLTAAEVEEAIRFELGTAG